jgi:serine/threonine protein kinase
MSLEAATALTGEPEEHKKDVAPPPTPETIAPLFPQLEILEYLGRGGMGIVYKARQRALDRIVALKILAPERECDSGFAERFAREAQALARLSHPHIVTIHDFGEVKADDGRTLFYLLMEFVDGVNLRQILRSRRLAPTEALAIVPTICDALQYAHSRGIVHRDIKPENLLLDKEGKVKVADFGIAKILGADAAAETGSAGTPEYMAPEQKSAPERVDHRADIYSLGVVLYEMLTGELPSKKLEAPSSHVTGVQFDVRLDKIVLRALHAQPELRYYTARDLKTEIESIAQPDTGPRVPASISAQRTSRHTQNSGLRVDRKLPRFLGRFVIVALSIIALFAGVAVILLVIRPQYYAKVTMEVQQDQRPYLERPWYVHELYQAFITEQSQQLRAPETIEKLVERLRSANGSVPGRQALTTAAVVRSIQLRAVRNTDLLEVGVYNSDPKLAADIANTLAQVYQENRLNQQRVKIDRDLARLRTEVERQRTIVSRALTEREAIRTRDGILDSNTESLQSSPSTSGMLEVIKLEKQLAAQREVVDKLKKQIATMSQLEPLEIREVMKTLEIKDPLVDKTFQSLNEALVEQVRLGNAGLGDSHPQVMANRAVIIERSRQLAQTLDTVRVNRSSLLQIEQRTLQGLLEKLDAAKKSEAENAAHLAPYLAAKTRYLQSKAVLGAAEAEVNKFERTAEFKPIRIWERAEPPPHPSWPSWRQLSNLFKRD